MHKTHLICSLLTAFGISMMVVGCQPSGSTPATKATKEPPKATSQDSSKSGGTAKGGTEVPANPSKGEAEKPK